MTGARFSYSVVASSLHDAAAVSALTGAARALLDELGGELRVVDPVESTSHHDVHLMLVATGGTEHQLLDQLADRHQAGSLLPVLLIAHGGHNALPAALETLAAMQQRGHRGRIVMLTGDVDTNRTVLERAVGDLEAAATLGAMRLGVVGGPSSWLTASSPEPEVVRRRWGPEVVVVEPTRMIELTRTPTAPIGLLAERFTAVADPVRTTVAQRAVDDALAVRSALDDVLEHEDLDAVTVRCFDLLHDPGTSGCLALASLNDDGIVAGCEGDVPSALAMVWVRALLGLPTWMANPADIDIGANRLMLAHCTVATSMVENFALDTHFESGMGVGISATFAAQPVTLIRLGGNDLERCWIAEGDIVATGADPDRCRTQVTVQLSEGDVRELLEHPLGNHVVLAAGHHRERLLQWWRFVVVDDAGEPMRHV